MPEGAGSGKTAQDMPAAGMPAPGMPVFLPDLLASWLPRQRWFPGRGAVTELAIISDVTLLAGDPALRHLIVEIPVHGAPARFQLLLGCRPEPVAGLGGALIGSRDGLAWYDALHDRQLADLLVRAIAAQQVTGPLRFVREAAIPVPDGRWPEARVLSAEQSNTSLVFGEVAIMKVLRRLFPGANPDLEVADALARLGSARVAAPYGWIETDLDGEPVLLAVLSQFLAGASDGWTMALDRLRRFYAREGVRVAGQATAADDTVPFAAEAWLLGEATAQLHADLAAAFGTRELSRAELAAMAGSMTAKLTEAAAIVPALRPCEARIAAAYAVLAELPGPVPVQRIHGDYHLGQVLRSQHGWVALDFEGEPAVPLAQRRALAPALRDVAGMLRSFDYAARHQLIGHPDAARMAAAADAWARACQAAFRAGYAAGGGSGPDGQDALLRALTLEKAVYEVVYEYRHRPDWLSIPLGFVVAA